DHWACENGVTDDECGVFPIPHGGIGVIGTDILKWKVILPGDTSSNATPHAHDLMTYGRSCGTTDASGTFIFGGGPGCNTAEWVSWYTYDILLTHPTSDSYDTDDPPALLVSGRIDATGAASFSPLYQFSAARPTADTIPAEDDPEEVYTIQGQDSRGNTLL